MGRRPKYLQLPVPKYQPRTITRVMWLIKQICESTCESVVAWDESLVDNFVKEFPESKSGLRVYTLGPNSCPMLNRTAAVAYNLGYIEPGVIGTQDARQYNQRTWCRMWTITKSGRVKVKGE
jgi:hypothetical protein